MSVTVAASNLPSLTKYELLEELGHGGMAVVYRARDSRLDREVAVKVIHKHLRESAEVERRFAAEARAVAKLRHPNIVEVYDVSGDDEPEKYLVVELIRGVTLRRLLEKQGALPTEVAAAIGLEIGSALAHAHAAGVIHRDVKPENVLVEVPSDPEADVRIKLTDFGIAKILDAQGVTSTGQVLGSPAHMAPEQIEGGEVDARADVFALGVLLYESMVGHLPFEGNNPAQVLRRVLEGSYLAADRANPLVGGRWSRILARALAKEPRERFESIEPFFRAINAELAATEVSDPKMELRAFFRDPDGYRAQGPGRLVPVLRRRGEAARRAGDIIGAAADFNRALAYAPQDPELPRLMLRLRRRTTQRRLLLLAGILGGGFSVVALGAYGLRDAFSSRSLEPSASSESSRTVRRLAPPPAAIASSIASVLAVAPVDSTTGRSATRSVDHRAHLVAGPPSGADSAGAGRDHARRESAPSAPQYRDVTFLVNPHGARVSVDDGPAEDLSFGTVKHLAVGTHLFRAEVPGNRCCRPLSRSYEVRRPEGDEGPQEIRLSLAFNDASLTASNAPPDGVITCPLLRVSGPAGQVYRVPMSALELDVSCDLESPGATTHTTSVRLRAGVLTSVSWAGR